MPNTMKTKGTHKKARKIICLTLYQKINSYSYYWYKCESCEYVGLGREQRIKLKQVKCECPAPSTLPEYINWACMHARCYNSANRNYKYYGKRGIKVANEWFDFWVFYQDMGPKPTSQHSIDRINVNLGYFKDNCRWATKIEQANNKG